MLLGYVDSDEGARDSTSAGLSGWWLTVVPVVCSPPTSTDVCNWKDPRYDHPIRETTLIAMPMADTVQEEASSSTTQLGKHGVHSEEATSTGAAIEVSYVAECVLKIHHLGYLLFLRKLPPRTSVGNKRCNCKKVQVITQQKHINRHVITQ